MSETSTWGFQDRSAASASGGDEQSIASALLRIVAIRSSASGSSSTTRTRSPRSDGPWYAGTGCPVHGHAQTAQEGIESIFRRVYHNPDGYERAGEFDFITYFECEDEHLATFDRVHQRLRDITRNPEWLYVEEGPIWRGRRVLKW